MSADTPEILIVRRSTDLSIEPPKGGVWKIAFADFMTAMMAFFLVMWLINVTDEETRTAVASYFNPVKLAEATVDKKGLRDPLDTEKDGKPEATDQRSSKESVDESLKGYSKTLDEKHERKPRYAEAALFEDPYAVLAALVAGSEPDQSADNVGAFETLGQSGEPGLNGGDAQRDPFDPVYWRMSRAPLPQDGPESGGADTVGVNLTKAAPEMHAAAVAGPKPDKPDPNAKDLALAAMPEMHLAADAAKPGETPDESQPLLKGDEVLRRGTATDIPVAPADSTPPLKADQQLAAKRVDGPVEPQADEMPETGGPTADQQAGQGPEAQELKRKIEAAIESIKPAPGVQVTQSAEGLLVTLMDDADFGMFAIGSAEPQPELIRTVDAIGKLLGERQGKIVVRGHTDGRPFRSKDYDNWRLSTARAHMAYYMLIRGGVPESRFEKIEGYADQQLKKPEDPEAPQNRRIEILIREPSA